MFLNLNAKKSYSVYLFFLIMIKKEILDCNKAYLNPSGDWLDALNTKRLK